MKVRNDIPVEYAACLSISPCAGEFCTGACECLGVLSFSLSTVLAYFTLLRQVCFASLFVCILRGVFPVEYTACISHVAVVYCNRICGSFFVVVFFLWSTLPAYLSSVALTVFVPKRAHRVIVVNVSRWKFRGNFLCMLRMCLMGANVSCEFSSP